MKDVCPIVGVEVGARVRAHFYYKNGQKSKSWREAQARRREALDGAGTGAGWCRVLDLGSSVCWFTSSNYGYEKTLVNLVKLVNLVNHKQFFANHVEPPCKKTGLLEGSQLKLSTAWGRFQRTLETTVRC